MNETTISANSGLEGELERERQKHAATRRTVEALKARVAELDKESTDALQQYWEIRSYLELRTEGALTSAELTLLRSFFHPDKAPQDEKEQRRFTKAFNILSRFEKLLKDEPLPPPSKRKKDAPDLHNSRA